MSYLSPNPSLFKKTAPSVIDLDATEGGLAVVQVDPASAGSTEAQKNEAGILSAFLTAAATGTARVEMNSSGGSAQGRVQAAAGDAGYISTGPYPGVSVRGHVVGGGNIDSDNVAGTVFGFVNRTTPGFTALLRNSQPGGFVFGSIDSDGGNARIRTHNYYSGSGAAAGHVESSGGALGTIDTFGPGFSFGSLYASGAGAVASIYTSFYGSSVAFGHVVRNGSGFAGVNAYGYGGFASGFAYNGYINAYSRGSFAHGYAFYGGNIRANSNGWGAHAGGVAYGNSVSASQRAAFAHGYAQNYDITASGQGSFAQGRADTAAIVASGVNSVQFGPGTNSLADSVKVGLAGLRFRGTTSFAGPANGDFGVDGSGNVLIRSGGLTKTATLFVEGPATATDTAIPRFNGTTGKSIQDSGWTISAANLMVNPSGGELAMDNGRIYIDADRDTYIFAPVDDAIRFITSSGQRFQINATSCQVDSSDLDVSQSQRWRPAATRTTAGTMANNVVIPVSTSGTAAFTVTLNGGTIDGYIRTIKDIGGNCTAQPITIVANTGDAIPEAPTSLIIDVDFGWVTLIAVGNTNWYIVAGQGYTAT